MNGSMRGAFLALCMAAFALQSSAGENRPDLRGKITRIHVATDQEKSLGTVFVEADTKAKPHQIDKADLIVTRETRIYEKKGAARMTFQDLKVGDLIEVQFVPGPRLEIYPLRVAAAEIVLLNRSGD